MAVTKNRVIYGDVIFVVALAALYFVTGHFTQNMLPMCLILLLLAGRSIFWHVTWYKETGKIY
jgi:hypothetical protein